MHCTRRRKCRVHLRCVSFDDEIRYGGATENSALSTILGTGEEEKTVHYGASNEIKEIEVCKKCPKVKSYCVPIFDPIMAKPFLDDTK